MSELPLKPHATRSKSDVTMEIPAYREGLDRLIQIQREAQKTKQNALVILHTPYGGGFAPLLKQWRRHVFSSSGSLFEGHCVLESQAYQPLRTIIFHYTRTLEALDLLDPETFDALSKLSSSLGIPHERRRKINQPKSTMLAGQLHFFDELGGLLVRLTHRLSGTIVLHHLHQADSATLTAVYYLLENIITDPVEQFVPFSLRAKGFQGTCVITVQDNTPVLKHLKDHLTDRSHTHFISLKAAEEENVRRYIHRNEVIEQLMIAAEGSVENLRDLLLTLPKRAEDLYIRKLHSLAKNELLVLKALAVIGYAVSPDFLLRVAISEKQEHPPSLSALIEARFLNRRVFEGKLVVDFPSKKNRKAVYELIEKSQKAYLHGRTAKLLEEHDRIVGKNTIELIAKHYLHSDIQSKAISIGLEAAEQLHISFAYQRAREILVALRPRVSSDPDILPLVLDRLIDVCTAMGDHEKALQYCTSRLSDVGLDEQGKILRKRGELRLQSGQFNEALKDFALATPLIENHLVGDDARLARMRLDASIAEAATGLGDYEKATAAATQGIARLQKDPVSEELREVLRLRNTLGKIHYFKAEFDIALESFHKNAACAKKHRWPDLEVRALLNQGTIALIRRTYDKAESIFRTCLTFGTQSSNLANWAFSHLNLAVCYHQTHRYAEALDGYLRALATFKRNNNDLQFAVTAMNLGTLYEVLGAHNEARTLLKSTVHIAKSRQIRMIQGRILLSLGELEVRTEHWNESFTHYKSAFALIGKTSGKTIAAQIKLGLARCAHGLQKPALRDQYLSEIQLEKENTDHAEVIADHALYQGFFLLDEAKNKEAISFLQQAVITFEKLDLREKLWLVRFYLAIAHAELHHVAESRRLLRSGLLVIKQITKAVPKIMRDRYINDPIRARLVSALKTLNAGKTPHLKNRKTSSSSLQSSKNSATFRRWRKKYDFIVTKDQKMLQIFNIIERISRTDSSVLILGESGTGKELIAEAVHRYSNRSSGPFIKINCAAFVETLLLSELFGHERGAFTGAMARKIGRFELANNGTLFIDEVGDISLSTQVALLRVLQEKTFERVGGSETIKANVRLICATNRNLEEMVRSETFRLDLYYRLKGVVIDLPPLQERRADIPLLVNYFATQFAKKNLKQERIIKQFSRDAMSFLICYSWPGNIRELENFVRSIILFVDQEQISLENIQQFDDFFAHGSFIQDAEPFLLHHKQQTLSQNTSEIDPETSHEPINTSSFATWAFQSRISLKELKANLELELIQKALVETNGNVTASAKILGMKRPRLSQIINKNKVLQDLRAKLTE